MLLRRLFCSFGYSFLCIGVSAGRLRVVRNDCLLAELFFLPTSRSVCFFLCREIRSLFVCLFVVVSVCPSVWLSVCLSVRLCLCLSVELIDCLFVCLVVCSDVCVYVVFARLY